MSRTRLAKAPYDKFGDLMDYVGTVEPYEWRDNAPFPSCIELQGTERGMSAVRFVWHTGRGHSYNMFLTDMTALIKSDNNLFRGTADTWWMIQKRGKNYGIRLADQDDFKAAGHQGGLSTECSACEGVSYSYVPECPLRPSPNEPHDYDRDRTFPVPLRCRCGLSAKDPIHARKEAP